MTIQELLVTIILSNSVWTMDPETHKPMLCVPKALEEDAEKICTQVPDEYLIQWVVANSTKV
jgi:hypothetical protein